MTSHRIGKYEILQHLATGGMGRIYLARATGPGSFERHVVVKTLDLDATESDDLATMFLDEARVVGQMHHQHIAPVYEVGRDDEGRYYFVMEYVHGENAHDIWEHTVAVGASLPLDFVVSVVAAAAGALHYAHTRTRHGKPLGVVHRDVSLSNLMIGYDGAVKLIDFGIAKAANRAHATQTGYVKGKLGYLAPEQLNGEVDQRTDIFALGVVLYELATMTRAFRDRSDLATLEKIKKGDFLPPSRVVQNFPRGLELIIMKAMSAKPAQRFQDADMFRRELEAFGHRNKLVLGDSSIIEVMTQLYDDREEPWCSSRTDATPAPIMGEENSTVPVTTEQVPSSVRKLRSVTELADQMVIEVRSANGDDETTTVPEETNDAPTAPITDLRVAVAEFDRDVATTRRSDAIAAAAEFERDVETRPRASSPGPLGVARAPTPARVSQLPPPLRMQSSGSPLPLPAVAPIGTPAQVEQIDGRSMTPGRVSRLGAVPDAFAPRVSEVPTALLGVREAMTSGPSPAAIGAASIAAMPRGSSRLPAESAPNANSGLKRLAILSSLVSLVLIGVGFVAFELLSTRFFNKQANAQEPAPQAAPPVEQAPVVPPVEQAPVVPPLPTPAPAAAPDSPPAMPAAPQTIKLRIDSQPAGATVLLDGERLGHTPFEGVVPAQAGVHTLKLRSKGFVPQKLEVELTADVERSVTLQAAGAI